MSKFWHFGDLSRNCKVLAFGAYFSYQDTCIYFLLLSSFINCLLHVIVHSLLIPFSLSFCFSSLSYRYLLDTEFRSYRLGLTGYGPSLRLGDFIFYFYRL